MLVMMTFTRRWSDACHDRPLQGGGVMLVMIDLYKEVE